MNFTDTIIAFAGDNPYLIGGLIMLSAFLEAVPLVGSLFPGSATVMVLSGAVGAAGGPIWPLVAWGGVGGFVGDVLGYWIGRHYGVTLREYWPFATRPALWDKVARFFDKHGGKSVVVSRFLPGARAVTPIAAGALGMRIPYFIVTGIIAALAWALVYVVPAAILGQLLSSAGQISARLVGAVLTIIVALALVVWLARVAASIAGPVIYRRYRALIASMEASRSPLARRIGGLLDPALATIGPHLAWGTVLLISAIGLFGIIQGILASTRLVDIDSSIRAFARSLRSAPVDVFMVTVTSFGARWVVALSVLLLVALLLAGRAWKTAAIVASVFAATLVFVPVIDAVLHSGYPLAHLDPASLGASFPGNNTTFLTLFCGIVAALATPALNPFGRTVVWSLAVAIATMVGLSRVYLDALLPSDVAGGLLLGLALTAVFAMIRTGFESEIGKSLRYPLLACLVFLLAGGVRAIGYHEADLARYAPRSETITIAEADWLGDGWRQVPLRRLDFSGEAEELISLQMSADPAALGQVLAETGWKRVPKFKTRDLFLFLSPATPFDMLPPLPLMEGGRMPAETFVRPGPTPDQRLVIRLWPTDFAIRTAREDRPLFVGSIAGETIARPYDALTMLDTRPAGDGLNATLDDVIRGAGERLAVFEREGPHGSVLLLAPRGTRRSDAVGSLGVGGDFAFTAEQ